MGDSRLGCQSSAIESAILNNEALPKTLRSKEIVVNNKQKLRLSFFLQMISHKCKVCYKRFPHPAHRDRHIRTHTGKKPFPCQECWKCDYCYKRFRRPSEREWHMRTRTDEQPFSCAQCRKRFARRCVVTACRATLKYLLIILTLVTISYLLIHQSGHCQLIIHRKSCLLTIMSK